MLRQKSLLTLLLPTGGGVRPAVDAAADAKVAGRRGQHHPAGLGACCPNTHRSLQMEIWRPIKRRIAASLGGKSGGPAPRAPPPGPQQVPPGCSRLAAAR